MDLKMGPSLISEFYHQANAINGFVYLLLSTRHRARRHSIVYILLHRDSIAMLLELKVAPAKKKKKKSGAVSRPVRQLT